MDHPSGRPDTIPVPGVAVVHPAPKWSSRTYVVTAVGLSLDAGVILLLYRMAEGLKGLGS
jgi:hypothetical protein